MITTWRKLLEVSLKETEGLTIADAVSCTLTNEQLDEEFFCAYGAPQGDPFTLWTKERVYFPAVYDGLEWVAHVARNPDGKPTDHVGGY